MYARDPPRVKPKLPDGLRGPAGGSLIAGGGNGVSSIPVADFYSVDIEAIDDLLTIAVSGVELDLNGPDPGNALVLSSVGFDLSRNWITLEAYGGATGGTVRHLFDNFSVTVNVPEPATLALLGAGLLLLRRRRRKA